ncbi:MAG TPA: adenylate/guanylate cyclase domain-containing protein [Actinomycetota bacterium]
MESDVQFATNEGIHIAYRMWGDERSERRGGSGDFTYVPTWSSNLDLVDQLPAIARGIDRLSSFARLIMYDRRGSGLSDRLPGMATLEEGMSDLTAVLDAAGSEQTALCGFNESGPLCALYAATYPDRVSHLILYGTFATTMWHEEYPWGQKPEERAEQVFWITEMWGVKGAGALLSPGSAGDERFLDWASRWQRNSVTRDALPEYFRILEKTDVRHVLETIQVPTLVLHRTDDPIVPVDNGRYLAEKIPGAKYVELPGTEHVPFFGDWEAVADELEEFVTGSRHPRESNRVLATILFTDIVGSTEKASALGDSRWRELLDSHDETTAALLERWQGRLVKATGDGLLATFDGPARAIRCASQMCARLSSLGLQVRCGLHTGEVEVRGEDVGGIAVHIGARVMELAQPGEILVSSAIPPLIAGSGVNFEERGSHTLKGVDGNWPVFAVSSM